MQKSRTIAGALVVVLLVGAGLATRIIPAPDAGAEAAPRVLPVATVKPEAAEGYRQARAFTGEIRARRTSGVGFDVAGRILKLHVQAGDVVSAEHELAQIDVRRVEAEMARLKAQRAEAAAMLAEMKAGPRREVIDASREVVRELRLRVESLERRKTRRDALRSDRRISEEELDDVSTELATTRARLQAAIQQLAELENGTRPERIAAQQARVDQLDASLARLQIDVDDAVLKAPYAGRVLERHVHEGVVVQPGQTVLTLVEDGHLEARVGLPVDVALGLKPGTTYDVRVDDETFKATLRDLLPATDPATRTQAAVFDLPQRARGRVVPGQIARLTFDESVAVRGWWLPSSALARGVRGLWSVKAVASEGKAKGVVVKHQVEVLHTEGDRVLVRGTLGADDLVIVGDGERVVPGMQVEPSLQAGR
ncbi:MAG: efflux RND transporter periplasmic adaptor subunit [Planctomycetota bacterium]|nr:efflux RND transporter periplasmic adaptor subunit [Planctomycetota bacterium]